MRSGMTGSVSPSLRASILIASAALLLASASSALAAPGATDLCTGDIEAEFASHGACVSAFETAMNSGNADAVGLCKFFGDNSGFRNPGQCVATLRQRGY